MKNIIDILKLKVREATNFKEEFENKLIKLGSDAKAAEDSLRYHVNKIEELEKAIKILEESSNGETL